MMASEKGGGAGPGHVGTHEGQMGPGSRQAAGLAGGGWGSVWADGRNGEMSHSQ